MNPTDELRRVLESKAVAAANAMGLAGKLDIGNSDFTPPQRDVWASFWFKTGGTKQIELGANGSMERTVGLVQFDVLAPEHTGSGDIARLSDGLRRYFNRKLWPVAPNGNVRLDVASVKTPFGTQARGGWFRYIVDVTFNYDYRDPDAQPFNA
jgi:hypothetical protein